MLNAIYLISIIIGVSAQNILKKPFTDKTSGRGIYLFGAITSFFAMIFFVVTSRNLDFNWAIVPYAIGFAAFYALATATAILAISVGSLSLTSLITSYSLMVPTFYGLFFLKDPVSKGLIPGLILLVVSLCLINKKSGDNKISFKWLLYVFLAFVGNGMCSVVQKMQQVAFLGAYKNEFMIIALAIVTVIMLVFTCLKERGHIKHYFRAGWPLAILCGLLNGMVNLFVMILSGRIPVSLMFPLISAGGIIVVYLVSRLLYKERLTKQQFIGFLIGIGAVILLNI